MPVNRLGEQAGESSSCRCNASCWRHRTWRTSPCDTDADSGEDGPAGTLRGRRPRGVGCLSFRSTRRLGPRRRLRAVSVALLGVLTLVALLAADLREVAARPPSGGGGVSAVPERASVDLDDGGAQAQRSDDRGAGRHPAQGPPRRPGDHQGRDPHRRPGHPRLRGRQGRAGHHQPVADPRREEPEDGDGPGDQLRTPGPGDRGQHAPARLPVDLRRRHQGLELHRPSGARHRERGLDQDPRRQRPGGEVAAGEHHLVLLRPLPGRASRRTTTTSRS